MGWPMGGAARTAPLGGWLVEHAGRRAHDLRSARPAARPPSIKAGTGTGRRLVVGSQPLPPYSIHLYVRDLAMPGSQLPSPAALSATELSELLAADRATDEPSSALPRSVLLLLDCRPFGVGSGGSLIAGAKVVLCPPMIRRRNKGKMPIDCIVSDDELGLFARLGSTAIVVLYDEESDSFECAAPDSILCLAAVCLAGALPSADLRFLKGGYKVFQAAFPQLCKNGEAQQTSPASPDCTPPPSAGVEWLDVRGPNEVLPYLYIGSLEDVADVEKLKKLGITAIISVCREDASLFDTFECLNVCVDDDQSVQIASWFSATSHFIDRMRHLWPGLVPNAIKSTLARPRCWWRAGQRTCTEKNRNASGKVLVHCRAGISRSAAVCLAYLIKAKSWSLEESLQFLRRARPCVSPNLGFMTELVAYAEQLEKEAAAAAAATACASVASSL